MYNWRFLLLAFLAALHPISSFSYLNSVDGRGQCCDNEPANLLREPRFSYGSLWQTSAKDNRVNLNQDIPKNRRHEVDFSVVRRSTGERRVADRLSERDTRRVLRAPFRLARNDMGHTEKYNDVKRHREFISVERDAHRIPFRDISRREGDKVRSSGAISNRAKYEQNRISMEYRRELRDLAPYSEHRNKENRETRNLLQRARDDVVFEGRRDLQIRKSSLRHSPRRDYRLRERMSRHELIQNELNKERDSVRYIDQIMSRSLERRDHKARDFRMNRVRDSSPIISRSVEEGDHKSKGRMEMREEFSQISRLNRQLGFTHRISRSLERHDYRVRDRVETRNYSDQINRRDLMSRPEFSQDHASRVSQESTNERRVRDISPRSRVADHNNQRMVREKRSTERSSSESRQQTRDLEQPEAAEMSNQRRVLRSRQDTISVNSLRAAREMPNNRVQRSHLVFRKMAQRLSGQNGRHMYENDVEEKRFRSRSLHMEINRERQPVNHREREDSANSDREEKRISRMKSRSFLDEKRNQYVAHRQTDRDLIDDRVLMIKSESHIKIPSSLVGNLRQTGSKEKDSISRDETRDTRLNVGRVRNSLEANRRLSHDRSERENERSESRLNRQQRYKEVSRTMRIRDNHQESRELRSREYTELSNTRLEGREARRSIVYDDREPRAFDRKERTMSMLRLAERPERFQVSRDLNRDVRMNTHTDNGIARNRERENNRFRSDERYAENHDSFVLRYKTKEAKNIFALNWQYLFYTLQVIYLCGILENVLTKDETGKKMRSLPWWTGPAHSLVKID